MAKSMLGFDIGSSQIKIAYWNGSEVAKLVAVETPENMIKNDQIISYDAMADLIKEAVKANGLHEKKAAVILPAEFAFLRRISVPYMTMDQLKVNIPYEFRDFLSDNKDKYYYDCLVNEVKNDEDGKPKEMDVYASAVSKEVIDDYRAMFRRAGLKLVIGVPKEIPFVNLLRKKGVEKTAECSILDLGHMSTALDIFTGCSFETSRIIDMGLKDVDAAIADSESVDEHVANTYKLHNHNDCQNGEAARRIYSAIAADIRKAVNFYGFSNRESNLQDIYICGGGAGIPALVDVIRETVELNVHEIGELLPPIKEADVNPYAFAAAIGATLQDYKPSENSLNVVIKEKAKIPVWKAAVGILLIVAAAAVFSNLCVYRRFLEVDLARAEVSRVQAQHDKYVEYLADYDEVAAEYARYSVGWMSDQEKKRVDRSRILEIVEKELVPTSTVISVNITENTASVQITGCTLTQVSGFVDKILAYEDVASVKMTSANTQDTENGLESATIIFTMVGKGGTK